MGQELKIIVQIINCYKNIALRVTYKAEYLIKKIYLLFRKKHNCFLPNNKITVLVGHSSNVNIRKLSERREDFNIICIGHTHKILNIKPDIAIFWEIGGWDEGEIESCIVESRENNFWLLLHPNLYKYYKNKGLILESDNKIITQPKLSFTIDKIDKNKFKINWGEPFLGIYRHIEIMLTVAAASGARNIHLEGLDNNYMTLYLDRLNQNPYHFWDSESFNKVEREYITSPLEFIEFLKFETDITVCITLYMEYFLKKGIKVTAPRSSNLVYLEEYEL